jgi:hypothetical protein
MRSMTVKVSSASAEEERSEGCHESDTFEGISHDSRGVRVHETERSHGRFTVRSMTIGIEVEVRNRYTGAWVRGFTLASLDEQGCLIRRGSDGVVLPAPFPVDHIRPLG